MKRVLLVLVCLLMVTSAHAAVVMDVGGKVDMPNLVRFSENLTLGIEGSKDVLSDVFNEQRAWVEDDRGFTGYLKVTYTGTLINFKK